jgi:uncharacterized protein (TIGR02001 family)
MKKTLQIGLGALGLAAASAAWTSPAYAIDGLTANAAITTNYVFRGISQSAKRPAVQGGLDYTVADTGFAVGTWVSSIDFGDDSNLEWDIYGNYNFNLGPVGASVGVIGYVYPYSGNFGPYDLWEVNVGLTHDFGFAAWSAKAFYAPSLPSGYLTVRNGYNPDQEYFLTTGVSIPVMPWLSISGNVGYQGYTGEPSGFPDDSYVEWDAGITLSYEQYALDLRYIDMSKHAGPGVVSFGPYFNTGPFYVATFSFKFS